MHNFDQVKQEFDDLPYMDHEQALVLRDLIHEENARDILEIGFYQGKSSAYIAAVLEDRGDGSLTTLDRDYARDKEPNIDTVLETMGLSHRVTPIYCFRSYTWELQRLINAQFRPQFDMCYFDGGHNWDTTGFGVLLVDMLLRPGGLLLLDDMEWSIAGSPYHRKNPKRSAMFSPDERTAKPVRLVWETILPHLGYEYIREHKEHQWGVARKPLKAASSVSGAGGRRSSLFGKATD